MYEKDNEWSIPINFNKSKAKDKSKSGKQLNKKNDKKIFKNQDEFPQLSDLNDPNIYDDEQQDNKKDNHHSRSKQD